MKKLLLFFGGIAGFCSVFSQTLSPEVLAAGGTNLSNAGGAMEFTIGEVLTATLTASGDVLTQGFNQPNIEIVGVEEFIETFSIKLFPNPTEQFLNLETESDERLQATIYNALGQKVMNAREFSKTLSVDVQEIANGKYFLHVATRNGEAVKNFTFIKMGTH